MIPVSERKYVVCWESRTKDFPHWRSWFQYFASETGARLIYENFHEGVEGHEVRNITMCKVLKHDKGDETII